MNDYAVLNHPDLPTSSFCSTGLAVGGSAVREGQTPVATALWAAAGYGLQADPATKGRGGHTRHKCTASQRWATMPQCADAASALCYERVRQDRAHSLLNSWQARTGSQSHLCGEQCSGQAGCTIRPPTCGWPPQTTDSHSRQPVCHALVGVEACLLSHPGLPASGAHLVAPCTSAQNDQQQPFFSVGCAAALSSTLAAPAAALGAPLSLASLSTTCFAMLWKASLTPISFLALVSKNAILYSLANASPSLRVTARALSSTSHLLPISTFVTCLSAFLSISSTHVLMLWKLPRSVTSYTSKIPCRARSVVKRLNALECLSCPADGRLPSPSITLAQAPHPQEAGCMRWAGHAREDKNL